ncbi:MAG: hypothetical protein QGG36_32815 [Pirellulaceae bacterium]|jgi:hypothetical protein|nr:hypothetical protein [Pirellulaceae bacterium]MDP7020629.1 hypothetical protein [Pirellulaceae bacterium]
MADDAGETKSTSDDWLKVLSVLALLSKDAPNGQSGSAVAVAFVVVGLSIYSRTVFHLLYFLATSFLIWTAYQSQQPLIVGYAALYTVLGGVLVAEGERRRVQKGQFLSAIWWAGQFSLHVLDIRHAYANGGASGFFTDLFCVICGVMAVVEVYRGLLGLIRRDKNAEDAPTVGESQRAA